MKFGNHIDLGLNELQNALIQKLGSDPAGQSSRIYYNTASNVLKYHNGTEWVSLGAAQNFQEVVDAPGGGGGFYDGSETFDITTSGNFFVSASQADILAPTTAVRGSTTLTLESPLIKLPGYSTIAADGTPAKTLGVTATGDLVKFDSPAPNLQSVTDVGNTTSNAILIDTGTTGLAFRIKGEIGGLSEDLLSVSDNAVEIEPNTTFNQDVYADSISSRVSSVPFSIGSTGGLRLPFGTTAQRPASPNEGLFRYNTDSNRIEGYSSTSMLSTNFGWFDVPMQISDALVNFTDTLIVNPTSVSDPAAVSTLGTAGTIQHNSISLYLNDSLHFTKYGSSTAITGTVKTILAVEDGGKVIETTIDDLGSGFVKLTEANQTITGNLTVDGDFTVTGNRVMTAPETVAIEDNLLYLNSNWASGDAPTQDAGFLINRGLNTSSGEETVGLVWDEGNNKFVFGSYGAEDGTGTTLTHTTQVDIVAANAEFSGLTINTATTEIGSPSGTDEVLVRDSSTGEVKHVNFSEFGSVKRATGSIVGDDSTTDWVISHNLGVQLVQVQIFNAASPFEMIITDVELTDANSATIKFAQNVPTGTSYNVIVIG